MKSPTAQHFTIEAELQQRRQQESAAAYANEEGFLFVQGGYSPHAPVAPRYTLQQVLQWSESRVCQWVRDQGFGKYESAFRENLVNGEALVELDYGLLKELSVRTVGERVRLNLAIRRLRQECLQVDVEFESPPPRQPLPLPPQLQQPRANRPGVEHLASPSPHNTAIASDSVPPSALHNAHAAAASSVATGTGASSSSLQTTSVVGNSAASNVVASAVSAMASVTAASPKPGIKDLPVLPRVSLSSTAIGINGNSNLQRANTDLRPFATIQDRKPKHQNHRPQLPHQLHHSPSQGGGSGVALRKPRPSNDNGSPLFAQPLPVGSLPHPLRPAAAKMLGYSAAKETAVSSQLAGQSLRRGGSPAPADFHAVEPMSAPLPRLRMLTSSSQQRKSPTSSPSVAPLQLLRDAIESNRSTTSSRLGPTEEIERLGLQFQEFFGTDISVSNLADSLSVKTWHVTITGPENQVRQVPITNTSSAQAILDR
ncbi:ATP binding, partial [Coemansia sp. 'formosensis']